MVEGVAKFKYLGKTLDQTDDDWPSVRPTHHACKVGMG